MPIARQPAQIVDAPGVYKVIHSQRHAAQTAAITLREGEEFPSCKVCGPGVSYMLVISAPKAGEDSDLKRGAGN